jgi:AAA15 family ATPase/GTPase
MHPGYIMELVKVISSMSEKQNVQFFITTHSPDLIDTFLSQESYLERERPYLQRELAFIKMDKIKEIITIPEILDYDAARENKEQFLLDLRGIA